MVLSVGVIAPAVAGDVPPNADAARQNDLRPPVAPQRSLQSAPVMHSAAPVLDPAIAAQKVVLRSVTFQGATAFNDAELRRPFADTLGREVTVADIFTRMAAVQQMYLDAGYTLSRVDIPEQDIAAGYITIRVVEGYVAHVDIAPELQDSRLVKNVAAEIMQMRPLNTRRLERLMLILSSRPGRETTAVLAPPEGVAPAGAVNMLMRPRTAADGTIDRDSGFASVDNHGSKFLGPWRASFGYRYGALFGTDADVGVAISASLPTDELKQLVFDTSFPVCGASGAVAELSGGITKTVPGSDLATLEVDGVSRFARAGINYPLILQRDSSWTVGSAFEYKNVATDLLGDRIFDDRLRTLSLTTSYQTADRFYGSTQVSAGYVMGFDILGERSPGAPNRSRAEGESAFRKATAGITRVQTLPAGFDMLVAAEGQYAWDPLLSSEEFGYGGQRLGRGYDASALVGDHGIAGGVEVRRAFVLPEAQVALQPYAFYDIGKVWNIDPSSKDQQSGASAGFGLRGSHADGWQADVSLAIPLTTPAEDAPAYASGDGARAYLQIRRDF